MTDGERLVWSTTYALVYDREGDAIAAAQAAAFAVEQLRRTVIQGILQAEARDFLDEIVNVP